MSKLSFTLVQTDLVWEDRQQNRQRLEEKIRSISNSQVVVLPEMFSTGFSMRPEELAEPMSGETVTWMKNLAASKKMILTGSVIIEEGGKYYNRLIWMLPNGQSGYYNKRHLFAYAEEDKHYTAGQERLIASVNGWKINLLVCYDLRFPVWSRQSPRVEGFEYDVLVYVANWPEKRSLAWRSLLRARAIENQCYVIGVNRVGTDGKGIAYNGGSTVIDPLGEILYEKLSEEDVFTITLDKEELNSIRERFPFRADADGFTIITGEGF
jgi:omega-amidase